MSKSRVLIVDDSALIRRVLRDIVSAEPDLEVVGSASDGAEAVRLVETLRPDVVTMDVEMPHMTGLQALKEIMRTVPTPVIMVSSLTHAGAQETLQALHEGAFDFVCKPNSGSPAAIRDVREELLSKIRHATTSPMAPASTCRPRIVAPTRSASDRIVLIASSTGGPRALTAVFESLPKNLPAPIVIVQHMPATFTASLAKRLDSVGAVPCRESEPGLAPTPGEAIIARGGEHLLFDAHGRIVHTLEPPIHGVRPAADLMFAAAAERFGSRCLAVILTGMGRDGATGAHSVKRAGGQVIVEAEASCAVYGMPRAAVALGIVDVQVPISDMGHAICEALAARGSRAA